MNPRNASHRVSRSRVVCLLAVLLSGPVLSARAADNPATVHDALWVWGTPEMATPGDHDASSFAQASPAQRAQILGVPNIIMAGSGLPHDRQLAGRWSADVAGAAQLVWEIIPDGQKEHEPPFEFTRRIADLAALVKEHPHIQAVLVDDMTSVAATKGFKPDHLRAIRSQLKAHGLPLKLWGVVYSMNLSQETTDPLVRELDVINLWHWHAKDTVRMEEHVAECQRRYPGKPIVLGLYLYDYGDGRPMSLEVHKKQCQAALRLLHDKRVTGIVFLSINDADEVVRWTANWVQHVGAARIGSPEAAAVSLEVVAADPQEHRLEIGDGADWHFLGGSSPWTESDGVIRPPNERNLASRAFSVAKEFGDFTAEYEFLGDYRETGTGAAAFVFRAADVNRGYLVYCPWGGQQLRAKHFWVQLMRLDGDGYLRSLKSVWVPGVPSETDRWYKVRVEASGPTIRVQVNGRRALEVQDDTYASGAVGLAGYGWYGFRDVKISAAAAARSGPWDRAQTVPVHHFTVGLDDSQMPSGCVAPNGDVLLAAGNRLARSKDKGRTWEPPAALPDKLGVVTDYGNTLFSAGGRLYVQTWRDERQDPAKDVPEITLLESNDNALTWSDPVVSEVAAGWPAIPAKLVPYGPLVQTADGAWVRFLLGGAGEGSRFTNVITWGATHAKAYCIRSTDQGKHWSAPIELDQPSWTGQPRGTIPGSLDLTEVTGVALGNRILAVARPIYSPYMWQFESNDSGAHWDAAVRTTFPGYAQSMARTQSGAIAVAHRFPQHAINLSRDDGLNWDEGTIIDYPAWAMGCLIEVEPNVLLATYMNWEHKNQPLLAQLIRVTPQRIEPIASGK